MNLLTVLLLAFAQDPTATLPPTTRAISADQELLLLRAVVVQQSSELALVKYKSQGRLEGPQLLALEARMIEAQQETNAAVQKAQEADKAGGCRPSLLPKPTWTCEVKK